MVASYCYCGILYYSRNKFFVCFTSNLLHCIFVCGILFCRYEKEVIDYLHLRSWGMMILLGVLSVSSPYIILPIYFAIIYALIGIFFSISLVLNLQKKTSKYSRNYVNILILFFVVVVFSIILSYGSYVSF